MIHYRRTLSAAAWSGLVGLGVMASAGVSHGTEPPEPNIAVVHPSTAALGAGDAPDRPSSDSSSNVAGNDAVSDESIAQSTPQPTPLTSAPSLVSEEPNRAFRQTGCFGDEPIATDKEIRQQGLTPPSLWLTRDLLGGKIVNRWTIHTGNDELPPWVEVTFNLQPWNNLEYPRQYAYLNEFGRVAREYGYNVRVCNSRGDTLAAQFCTWDQMRGWSTCPIYLPGGFSARVRSPLF